mgnify:CR=1 FL=1
MKEGAQRGDSLIKAEAIFLRLLLSQENKMKFIDEARIHVYAGKGGGGCLSFRREKFFFRVLNRMAYETRFTTECKREASIRRTIDNKVSLKTTFNIKTMDLGSISDVQKWGWLSSSSQFIRIITTQGVYFYNIEIMKYFVFSPIRIFFSHDVYCSISASLS